jgi:hypothetical protein
MTLPEEVQRRLAARAVTDPDVACMLATFTTRDKRVNESVDQAIGNARNIHALKEAS